MVRKTKQKLSRSEIMQAFLKDPQLTPEKMHCISGRSLPLIYSVLQDLYPGGWRRYRIQRDRQRAFAYLKRNPETTIAEIARYTGRSIAWVWQHIFSQRSGGKEQNAAPSKGKLNKVLIRSPVKERQTEIVQLAQQNPQASVQDLAKQFGYSPRAIHNVLAMHGLLAGREVRPRRQSTLEDPLSPRCQLLRKAIEEDWTLERLGNQLQVTRERARQLISAYQYRYGVQKIPRVFLREAAQQLKVSAPFLLEVALSHNIGLRRGKRHYMFTAEDLKTLAPLLDKARQRACKTCGREFSAPPHKGRKFRFCSVHCRRKARREWHQRPSPATEENSPKWGRVLRYLQQHRKSQTEWTGLANAVKISGLSRMQVGYLGMREVVRTRPSSTHYRHGRPAREYAVADLIMIREYLSRRKQIA